MTPVVLSTALEYIRLKRMLSFALVTKNDPFKCNLDSRLKMYPLSTM